MHLSKNPIPLLSFSHLKTDFVLFCGNRSCLSAISYRLFKLILSFSVTGIDEYSISHHWEYKVTLFSMNLM